MSINPSFIPSSPQSKLSLELQRATTVEQIYKLLQICDLLHAGQEVPNYTIADLPTDAEYEAYKTKYNYQTDTMITESTIMYMSTIPKEKQIVEVHDAIIMAKYDGVSAATLFTKTEQLIEQSPSATGNPQNAFVLKAANTRGRTIGNTITNTDIKPKLDKLVKYITFDEEVFKSLFNLDLSQTSILNVAARGEIILNRKQLDNVGQTLNHPAAAVAGLINGGIENFVKEIDNLCLQLYEIAYIDVITSQDVKIQTNLISSQTSQDIKIPAHIDPIVSEPAHIDPIVFEPAHIDPIVSEPAHIDPIVSEHAHIDPILSQTSQKIQRIIPTQEQAVILLKNCYIYYKYVNPVNVANPQLSLDSKIYTAENTVAPNITFNGIYEDLLESIYYPTDGLVYCARDWRYPQNKEAFGKKGYGKHAWKPTNSCYSCVESIEWPITKNGELNPIVHFTEFQFNGTKYSQCKMAMGQLIEFQKSGFGIGAQLLISIVNLKTAHIDEVIKSAKEVYKIPTTCPYCKSRLILEDGKATSSSKYVPKHLKCVNPVCAYQKIQKYAFFLTSLGKLCKLTYLNDSGKVIKTKISEKKLEQIYMAHRDLNNKILLMYVPDFLEALNSLSHENQLVVLSVGGIKQVQALIQQNHTTSWKQYNIEWFK